MRTPRSTALAERLIVWTCIIVGCWFLGYEFGIRQVKGCVVPEAKVHSMTNPPLYRGVNAQKRWAKYEATK